MKILSIGAHPDDIELGSGGVLALFKKKGREVNVLVLTRDSSDSRLASRVTSPFDFFHLKFQIERGRR